MGPGADFFAESRKSFIARQIRSNVTRSLIKINPVEGARPPKSWAIVPFALPLCNGGDTDRDLETEKAVRQQKADKSSTTKKGQGRFPPITPITVAAIEAKVSVEHVDQKIFIWYIVYFLLGIVNKAGIIIFREH